MVLVSAGCAHDELVILAGSPFMVVVVLCLVVLIVSGLLLEFALIH